MNVKPLHHDAQRNRHYLSVGSDNQDIRAVDIAGNKYYKKIDDTLHLDIQEDVA